MKEQQIRQAFKMFTHPDLLIPLLGLYPERVVHKDAHYSEKLKTINVQ